MNLPDGIEGTSEYHHSCSDVRTQVPDGAPTSRRRAFRGGGPPSPLTRKAKAWRGTGQRERRGPLATWRGRQQATRRGRWQGEAHGPLPPVNTGHGVARWWIQGAGQHEEFDSCPSTWRFESAERPPGGRWGTAVGERDGGGLPLGRTMEDGRRGWIRRTAAG
jgi:hypothetical protein